MDPDTLAGVCAAMREAGCDALVLGCTELSEAFARAGSPLAGAHEADADSLARRTGADARPTPLLIDSLTVLADAIVEIAGARPRTVPLRPR